MKNLLCTLIFLSFNITLKSQDYIPPKRLEVSQDVYEHYVAVLKKNYLEEPYTLRDYNIAVSYAYLGEDANMVFQKLYYSYSTQPIYLCRIIGRLKELDKINATKIVFEKLDSIRWDSLCSQCALINEQTDSSVTKDEKKYSSKLINEIKNLKIRDQHYRKLIKDTEIGNVNVETQWEQQKNLDSLNLNSIDRLLKEYNGYIGKTLVGEYHQDDIVIMILHFDLVTQERYFPMIRNAALKGELRVNALSLLVDRILVKKGQKQLFGTQRIWNKDKKVLEIAEIEKNKLKKQKLKELGIEILYEKK